MVILCDRAFILRKRSDSAVNAGGMSGSIARERSLPKIRGEVCTAVRHYAVAQAPENGMSVRATMPSVDLAVE